MDSLNTNSSGFDTSDQEKYRDTVMRNFLAHSFSGYPFELFVINVLRDYLHAQGKELHNGHDVRDAYDAFLPDGIDGSDIPTDVEVKFLKTNKSSYWRAVEQICKKLNGSKSEQLLLVLGTEFSEKSKEQLDRLPAKFTLKPVMIWDINDFRKITKDYWGANIQYLELPEKAIVEKAILEEKSHEQVFEEQDKILNQLKQKYLDEDLVLVLGAGVSIDARIPLWNDLIKKLLVEMVNKKLKLKRKSFSKIEVDQLVQLAHGNMEDSPLAQMRYIRNAFNNDEYKSLIRAVLYENNPKSSTDLLKAISQLCTPRRRHLGIKSIITYNFDDLIERRLKSRSLAYTSIYREIDASAIDNLNIYHVHGFLPRDFDDTGEDINLVFSEEDYHKVYRDAYCWSNIIQLNSFRESTCLFVGCSLNDPNLRRLLDVAARSGERPRHYAIMKKHRLKGEGDAILDPRVFEAYEGIDNSIRESYFRSLGISIIWVNSYDEIPNILLGLLE